MPWYNPSAWGPNGDPSQAPAGSATAMGMAKGIDPRNYATHDDWANAIAGLSSPNGQAGTWTAQPNQVNGRAAGPDTRVYGGSTGQYPAATGAPATPGQYQPGGPGTPFVNRGQPLPWQTPAPVAPNARPASQPGFVDGPPMFGGPAGSGGAPVTPPGAGSSPYPLDPSKYLDPSMAWETAQGLRSLGSSASAAGQTFAGNTLKEIMDYSQGRARTNFNNATNVAQQQQGFGRGVDVNNRDFTQGQNVSDRDFAYQAQLNDQTIPFSQRMAEATLGMQGQGQQSQLAAILAQLQSQNTLSGGQAAGAGAVGSNNAVTSMITQLIAQMGGQNALNQYGPIPR